MPYSETVDGLKKEIKHQKAPGFDDIAADELTLWRVSIPVADDNDEVDDNNDLPILLNNIPKNDKKKLKAVTQKVFNVFGNKHDEKMIHVIVQWPPSGNACRFSLRSITPYASLFIVLDHSRPGTPLWWVRFLFFICIIVPWSFHI